MLSSNIISLGYVIDKTFGKNTLRTIGELEDDINVQEKYIEAL